MVRKKSMRLKNSRRFTLTIECDNDAFANKPSEEIARLLRAAADRVQQRERDLFPTRGDAATVAPLIDANGNMVGKWAAFNESTE